MCKWNAKCDQQIVFEPEKLFGNEALRRSFKIFKKFSIHDDNHGSVFDVIRLDAVMTGSIDAPRSTGRHSKMRGRQVIEKHSRALTVFQSLSPNRNPSNTFQLSKKEQKVSLTRQENSNGTWATVSFVSQIPSLNLFYKHC